MLAVGVGLGVSFGKDQSGGPAPPALPAFAGASSTMFMSGVASGNMSFGVAPPAGSTVYVGLSSYDGANTDPVVTDNQGNTYTKVLQAGSLTFLATQLYRAQNVTSSGTFTITVTGTGGNYITGAAAAFRNVFVGAADASGTHPDAAALTGQTVTNSGPTTKADGVSISVVGPYGYTNTVGPISCAGFTEVWQEPVLGGGHQPGAMFYRIESSIGVKSAVWSWANTANTQANSLIATFKGV